MVKGIWSDDSLSAGIATGVIWERGVLVVLMDGMCWVIVVVRLTSFYLWIVSIYGSSTYAKQAVQK